MLTIQLLEWKRFLSDMIDFFIISHRKMPLSFTGHSHNTVTAQIRPFREAPQKKRKRYLGIALIAFAPPPALKRALWGTFCANFKRRN